MGAVAVVIVVMVVVAAAGCCCSTMRRSYSGVMLLLFFKVQLGLGDLQDWEGGKVMSEGLDGVVIVRFRVRCLLWLW